MVDTFAELFTSVPTWIAEVATTVTSLTIILGFYHQFVKKPYDAKAMVESKKAQKKKESKEEAERRKILDLITDNNQPLTNSIDGLIVNMTEDRQTMKDLSTIATQNSELLKNQAEQITNLDRRLLYLEVHHSHYTANGSNIKIPSIDSGKELEEYG